MKRQTRVQSRNYQGGTHFETTSGAVTFKQRLNRQEGTNDTKIQSITFNYVQGEERARAKALRLERTWWVQT